MNSKTKRSPRLETFTPQNTAATQEGELPVPVVAPQLPHTPELLEKIRTDAYALWLERGQRQGYAEQDWFNAEAEVMTAIHTIAALSTSQVCGHIVIETDGRRPC